MGLADDARQRFHVRLSTADDFDGWRDAARGLAEAGISPDAISWQVAGEDGELFAIGASPPHVGAGFAVPRDFVTLAKAAICHSDPERYALVDPDARTVDPLGWRAGQRGPRRDPRRCA